MPVSVGGGDCWDGGRPAGAPGPGRPGPGWAGGRARVWWLHLQRTHPGAALSARGPPAAKDHSRYAVSRFTITNDVKWVTLSCELSKYIKRARLFTLQIASHLPSAFCVSNIYNMRLYAPFQYCQCFPATFGAHFKLMTTRTDLKTFNNPSWRMGTSAISCYNCKCGLCICWVWHICKQTM